MLKFIFRPKSVHFYPKNKLKIKINFTFDFMKNIILKIWILNIVFYLAYFKNKNVRCCYDNARVASSVNILFLCVLPSQLPLVVQDIKTHLPDKCIIYNLVQTESAQHFKNLICDEVCRSFIIKPDLNLNKKFMDSSWNFSLSVTEALGSLDIIKMSNPFADSEGRN